MKNAKKKTFSKEKQNNQKNSSRKPFHQKPIKKSETTYTGRLTITKSGDGLVYIQELDKKVEIRPRFLGTALHRDTVELCLHGQSQNNKETLQGEIVSIVKKSKSGFAGKLIKEDNAWFVNVDDPRMQMSILVPSQKLNHAKLGQKVFVVIEKWTNRKLPPLGRIEKVLGVPGEMDSEMHGIALEKGFDWEFPKDVVNEAKKFTNKISSEELKTRKDIRGTTTFTIDPADAKDFDDALSFKQLTEDTYEIGIHIADVSFYVQPGTKLNEEAFDRATSVYLVDRTIPMLPENLSNDLCSLNPNEDKRTFSAIFTMNKDGKVLSEWFGRTLIHSDKRFTYEDAQEGIEFGKGPFASELQILNSIAKKLAQEKFKNGALVLETDEVKFKLNENGKPIAVERKERKDAHKMIEEFMLLANRRVARFCGLDKQNKNRLSVYRVHEEPSADKTKSLVQYLDMLGYSLKLDKGKLVPRELNNLVDSIVDEDAKGPVQTMIIRSMQKARYSTKNFGHFGLAFEYYTHFTSPIRRYPDILVHRILQTYLEGKSIPKKFQAKYEEQCEHSSEQEKEAMEAERKSVKIKQVEYMSERIGERFDGIVTGITNWGIFVEEVESKAEGMIPLRDLTDDMYILNEDEFVIRGKKKGREFKLGNKIGITVKKVNLEEYTIDYQLR